MKKYFLVLGLIFLLSFNTTRIYAYWQDTNKTYVTDDKPVEIISQDLVTEQGKQLVPKGSILGVNDVEEVVFTYKVFIEEGKTLDINAQNLTINGVVLSSELSNLFVFNFQMIVLEKESLTTNFFKKDTEGTFIQVTLHISMKMPTYNQYETIAGGALNFDVVFEAK